MNPHAEAVSAYEAANERAAMLRQEWDRLGRPFVAAGSKGQPVPHPILKSINDCEMVAQRLRQEVIRRHRGPDAVAVVKAGISPSPARRNGRP